MKLYLQCLIILLLFGYGNLFSQEVTLFDRGGNARAYIDYSEDFTIFLWNGKPVAFLEKDGTVDQQHSLLIRMN